MPSHCPWGYLRNHTSPLAALHAWYFLFLCEDGWKLVLLSLFLKKNSSFLIWIVYFELVALLWTCIYLKETSETIQSHVFFIMPFVYCLTHLRSGITNHAPGGLPSCRFQLQPQSNTPEPAKQGVGNYWIITEVCWSRIIFKERHMLSESELAFFQPIWL